MGGTAVCFRSGQCTHPSMCVVVRVWDMVGIRQPQAGEQSGHMSQVFVAWGGQDLGHPISLRYCQLSE